MIVTHLNIINFRNYISQSFDFSNEINIIYGDNAQGKTNLLESIFILSSGKSFRRSEDNEIIKFGEESSLIEANIIKKKFENKVIFQLNKNSSKNILINGKKISNRADYIGNFNVTMFSPDDLLIIKGDASYRRRFLDSIICQIDKIYLFDLINYYKVLKHRNFLLKAIKNKENKYDDIDPWNDQLIKYASKIVEKRTKTINFIKLISQNKNNFINNDESIDINYSDTVYCDKDFNSAEYEKEFKNKQKRAQIEEVNRGTTLFGPHRDDIFFMINNLNIRLFGSQGQQRSMVINLKLAEVELIYSVLSEYPIVLWDDIFSELDEKRRRILMKLVKHGAQIFITGTRLDDFHPLTTPHEMFLISEGRLTTREIAFE